MHAWFPNDTTPRAVVDACALAHSKVCDLLLRLHESHWLIWPLWTEQILEETYRAHRKFGWSEEVAVGFRKALQGNLPASMVRGHERWLAQCKNDVGDRHVLAAAIEGKAHAIITFNEDDFKQEALAPWGIEAVHPQDYLLALYSRAPRALADELRVICKKSGISVFAHLEKMAEQVPEFSQRLLVDWS